MQLETALLRIKSGDRDAEWAVLQSEESLIAAIARSWVIPGLAPEDVFQEARIEALRAVREFDHERGTLRAYLRRRIPRHLQKVKESRMASTDEPDEVDGSTAAQLPDRELQVIRSVWPYMTDSERRGVLVMLDEGSVTVAAGNAHVTKQAVSRGWTNAKRLIQVADREGLQSILVERPNPSASPLDWQLELLLSRLSA